MYSFAKHHPKVINFSSVDMKTNVITFTNIILTTNAIKFAINVVNVHKCYRFEHKWN